MRGILYMRAKPYDTGDAHYAFVGLALGPVTSYPLNGLFKIDFELLS